MENLKERALAIASKYSFEPFPYTASASTDEDGANGDGACTNHLDASFMKLLEEHAHLDIQRMPI